MGNPGISKSWEGRTVDGKFRLGQWIGGSEHAAVFLTERPGQPQSPAKAAIKLIAVEGPTADRKLSYLRAAGQFSHPHLIAIYDSGKTRIDNTAFVYVVMENAEEDLSQILPQRALSPAEVTEMLPAVLDGLSYLHAKGFVHTDVKPSNILATGEQLKLSSDSVAPVNDSSGEHSRRDVYDAPETATVAATPASDVWSVGVTIVAALTQNVPFSAETSSSDPSLPAAIPEPFRGIARECLRVDPKRRCSIADIHARLEPSARSIPAPPPPFPPPRKPIPRTPILAGVAVIALLIVLIAFFSRGKTASAPRPTTAEKNEPAAVPAPKPTPATPQPDVIPQQGVSGQGDVSHRVMPEVSPSAQNTITGTIKVTARVEVDPSGKVRTANLKTKGPSRYFASQALKAAEGWEFTPPQMNGQPIPSTWLIQFRFKRSGTQASAQRVTR